MAFIHSPNSTPLTQSATLTRGHYTRRPATWSSRGIHAVYTPGKSLTDAAQFHADVVNAVLDDGHLNNADPNYLSCVFRADVIAWLCDAGAVGTAARGAVAGQIKTLRGIRTALAGVRPSSPAPAAPAVAPANNNDENPRKPNKVKELLHAYRAGNRVCNAHASLPFTANILTTDLRATDRAKDYIGMLKHEFGVNCECVGGAVYVRKLGDINKFNRLLVWSAAFLVRPGFRSGDSNMVVSARGKYGDYVKALNMVEAGIAANTTA